MSYRIVTLSREHACGASELGQQLGAELGWKLYDHELNQEIARRAGISPQELEMLDERPSTFMAQFMKVFRMGGAEGWAGPPPAEVVDADFLVKVSNTAVREAAERGENCVIVGHGAQCILRERSDAFHVFVYASTRCKLKRLQRLFSSEQQACATIREIEQMRAAYIKRYYGKTWHDPHLYHMMVSTDVGVEAAAAAIAGAVRPSMALP